MEKSDRRKTLERILGELCEGTVIVEGRHDVNALARLRISAIAEGSIERQGIAPGRTVYLLMDNDRRGEERKERLAARLLETHSDARIDTALGKRLQRMLNITSIEQLCMPVSEALGE